MNAIDSIHSIPYKFARFLAARPALARLAGMYGDTNRDAVPSHVPEDLVRDLDIHHINKVHPQVHMAWKSIQDEAPPIFYTPHYGGHWVIARADLIAEAFPDHELFSSEKSIGIPLMTESAPPMLPIASDPPLHRALRHPINLAVSPKAVKQYSEEARELAIDLIEDLKPKGGCEFVSDFAAWLPMTIFLRMVDLPIDDRAYLMSLTEHMVRGSEEDRLLYGLEVFEYLDRWVRKRRRNPGPDLISNIVTLKIDGEQIDHKSALGECAQVLFGGLDTVAGTMGFIANYLATDKDLRTTLHNDPSLIPKAIEELLRRFSIPTVARRITRDVNFHGVKMKAGDQIMLPTCLHGLDDTKWDQPLKVDINREIKEHCAFGKGIHKCPGAMLARAEIKIFLEEWLSRIPEFTIKPDSNAVDLPGQVMGISEVHLTWPTNH